MSECTHERMLVHEVDDQQLVTGVCADCGAGPYQVTDRPYVRWREEEEAAMDRRHIERLTARVAELEQYEAILAAVREDDDLVSRLESVAMSWCLAGLGDALDRAKRRSTKLYADLVDAMKYAMGASRFNPDNANGAGDQRWEDDPPDPRGEWRDLGDD